MSDSRRRQVSSTSIPVIIAGVVASIIAAYFGFDLGGNSSTSTVAHSTAATTVVSSSRTSPTQNRTQRSEASSQRRQQPAPKRTTATANDFENFEECPVSSLPPEADETIADILSGQPYDHPGDDNKHFGNYERVLPDHNSDYYREFTVDTPGVRHRGERRIVTGGGTDIDPDVWLYTDDHYESFCLIPDAEE